MREGWGGKTRQEPGVRPRLPSCPSGWHCARCQLAHLERGHDSKSLTCIS